jgi:hypothetical protein
MPSTALRPPRRISTTLPSRHRPLSPRIWPSPTSTTTPRERHGRSQVLLPARSHLAPYSYSSVPGFTEHLDSGAQVFSITNSFIVKSNLSTTETLGVLREKTGATTSNPSDPIPFLAAQPEPARSMMFGSNYFPGVSIYNVLGSNQPPGLSTAILNIGPNAEGQSPTRASSRTALLPLAMRSGCWASTPSASAPATPTRSSTPSTSAPAKAPLPPTTSAR